MRNEYRGKPTPLNSITFCAISENSHFNMLPLLTLMCFKPSLTPISLLPSLSMPCKRENSEIKSPSQTLLSLP